MNYICTRCAKISDDFTIFTELLSGKDMSFYWCSECFIKARTATKSLNSTEVIN